MPYFLSFGYQGSIFLTFTHMGDHCCMTIAISCTYNSKFKYLKLRAFMTMLNFAVWYTVLLYFQFSKDYHNLFTKAGVPPKRKLTRFWITPDAAIQPGICMHYFHIDIDWTMKSVVNLYKSVRVIAWPWIKGLL